MALVRKAGGQLVETVIQDAGGQPAPTPVTPAGAAAAGASPDQAKMAGTPAQKAPVLKEAVAPQDTLQAQQRLTPQTQPASPADQQAAEKAGRLKSLGSYGTRVQAFIQERLTAATQQAPTLGVNADYVSTLFPGADQSVKRKQVRDAVAKHLRDKTPETLQALSTLIGRPVDAQTLAQLTTDATTALSQATAGLTQDAPPTLAQIGLDKLGVDPTLLAQDLGVTPEALAALTPDQLQQAVQDTLNREFASVDALKAEYRSASPQRKEQILQQLRQADASGRSGVETSVAHLSDVLESQESVNIGGQEFNIADVLSDDGMSKLIENALTSEDALKALEAPNSPATHGLAAWIRKNKTSLATLVADMSAQATQGVAATDKAADILKPLGAPGSPLAVAFGGTAGPMTPAQATALEAKLAADPLYQAALKDPGLMTWLQGDPRLVAKLRTLPQDQWAPLLANKQAWDTTDARLQKLVTDAGLNPAQLTDSPKIAAALKALTSAGVTDLDGFTAAVAKQWPGKALAGLLQDPVAVEHAAKSYALLADPAYDDTLRTLMGVPRGAAFSLPGKGPTPAEMVKWKARYDATVGALAGDVNAQDGFKALVADGTVDTPAELKAIRANPALLTEIIEDRQTQKSLDSVTKLLANPKTVAKGQEALAKAILGPSAKFADIVAGIDSANSVLKSPSKFSPDALDRAKAFLKQFAAFDSNGNGLTSDDLRPNPNTRYTDPAGVAARTAANVAARLAEMAGVDSADSLLAGEKPKRNALSRIKAFWDTDYAGWGTGTARYPGATDTSAADDAQAGMDKEAKAAAIAAAAAEMATAGEDLRQAETALKTATARKPQPNATKMQELRDTVVWRKKLLERARQKHKDAVAAQ